MLHPTLVLTFPGALRHLIQDLPPVWQERLGIRALCLEVGEASSHGLALGLQSLLSQPRIRQLQESGYVVDSALNLVVMAGADDPALPGFTQQIQGFFGSKNQGFEVRLHIVLLWPETGDAANLDALAPNAHVRVSTRVWPLTRWTMRGLWLPSDEHFRTWLQHFVEVLVLKDSPLNPHQGLEWAGLGVARLEWGQPDPCHYLLPLWNAVAAVNLGPSEPPPDLTLPSVPTLDPPRHPRDRKADDSPHWQREEWRAYLERLKEEAVNTIARTLNSLEDKLISRYLQNALAKGLPALEKRIESLREKEEELLEEQRSVLEEVDRLSGLEGVRAQISLLEKQQRRGRPINSEELSSLLKRLAPLEEALEIGNIDYFLGKDTSAQEATRRLRELEEAFTQSMAKCQETFSTKAEEPPPSPWVRILQWIKNILLPKRYTPAPASANLPCERTWRTLEHAYTQYQIIAERYQHYLSLWMKVDLLESLRLLIQEQVRKAQDTLSFATSVKIEGCPEQDPQVFRYAPVREVPSGLLKDEAQRLIKQGILQFVAAGDAEGLQLALLEGAQRLAEKLPQQNPNNVPIPTDVWQLLMDAAAPTVPVANWPDHKRYTYVLGRGYPDRWTESLIVDNEWMPGETLVIRFVYPLKPDQVLRMQDETYAPPEPLPPEIPKSDEGVVRENELLDEIF